MTIRNLTVRRTVLVALTAAVLFVPLTSAVAQRSIDDRNATSSLAVKDGTEHIGNNADASKIQEVRSYPRSNYIWPYASGPRYAAVDVNEQGVVWTPAGVFQLTRPLGIPSELRAGYKLDQQDSQVFVVQYHDEIANEEDLIAMVEQNGGKMLASPNSGSLIVRLNHQAFNAVQSAFGLLAVEPYHGAFKLEPKIGRVPLNDPVKALSDVYTLEVSLWNGEDAKAVADAITAIGGTVTSNYGDSLVVELNRALLPQLTDLDAISRVDEQLPINPMGEETTTTMQTGQYNHGAIPYHDAGVDGSGGMAGDPQVLMVLDSGFQVDAGDLSDTRVDAGTPGPSHRKVRLIESTNQFGGTGDTSGCDAPPQGGFTHGHVVSATALGNATAVDVGDYGAGWIATDLQGNPWNLDGVAPGAVLVGYDAQITPPAASCADPLLDNLFPGDLYAAPSGGSLGESYVQQDARTVNFSWGSPGNVYTNGARDIDNFMFDKRDALVFVSAGNAGADNLPQNGDGIPDLETLGAPATTKNGFAIGASRNANTVNSPESRAFFSSTGPAVDTTANRIAPQLMAPGDEPGGGTLGISSEFTCRSNDNDQNNPVLCDIISGVEGTSFSAPAAAGTGVLVRDYFRQGFHPSAAPSGNSIEVGAALVKAVLIASADYMSGANLTRAHRWNNEQGYGRIQLDNALPLATWPASPTGMMIHDPFSSESDLGLPFTLSTGQSASTTFEVNDDDQELRIAMAWLDPDTLSGNLRNDLNLKLVSPSGLEYRGNYYTDDNDQDGTPEANEDCGGIGEADPEVADGFIDENQWSLPVCSRTNVQGKLKNLRPFDNSNPTEAIFLSPDPEGDDDTTGGTEGTCTPTSNFNANGPCANNLDCRNPVPGNFGDGECDYDNAIDGQHPDYKQVELGVWELTVAAGPGTIQGNQEFALAISGGVAIGSSVRFDLGTYTCNQRAVLTVTEVAETGDENPTEADVEGRVTVEVRNSDGDLVDSEDGFNFTKDPNALKFESDPIQLTALTERDPGNGVLDVRDGDSLRVVYDDTTATRSNTATVGCRVDIGFGSIVFAQFGQDSGVFLQGGCERNERMQFEFGFPDRYMDADEALNLSFAFNSNETEDLEAVEAALSCVNVDDDSPKDCLPSGAGCDPNSAPPEGCGGPCDPLRLNNTPCEWMDILDSPQVIGFVPAGAAQSANFSIQMAGDGASEPFEGQPTPTVELLLEIQASVSGKTASGLAVSRHRLNVDTDTLWYSTDFPGGGSEVLDWGPGVASNNDEIAMNPITENANFQSNDYRFETFNFSPLTDNGKNQNLLAPWNFDGNSGGFSIGLNGTTDETSADIFNIANWGEDKNFNGIEDGICLSDPATACYNFGTNTDVRCPVGTICQSVENNAGGTGFVRNWNTKGGCGWQTRATGECTNDNTRGCFDNEDCLGTCQVVNNGIASGFESCSGSCPQSHQCSDIIPNPNPLAPCDGDADCGDVPGSCVAVNQQCFNFAGTCGGVVGDHTGGVWHTGAIGTPQQACDGGAASACANYRVIGSNAGQLIWWELLVTPVMEKVNSAIGDDGIPEATIEIFDWGWNSQVNLVDNNVAYSWELDTDLETLIPADLFSDGTALNFGFGSYGAINPGSNPDLSGGWSIFAPQCACTTAPFGPCSSLFQCNTGTCTNGGEDCHVDADCDPGTCSGGDNDGDPCFSNGDCPGGTCVGAELCANAPTCDCSGNTSVNGTLGPETREGQAGCFFEGNIDASQFIDLGTSKPFDDDLDNDGDGTIDEFVQADGPFRNHDIVAFNGPDMRFGTLEDIYGDTGDTFQAAIGFINFEGTPQSLAQQSYGLAVDDMVVKWREFTLEPDSTNCATSGSCAVVELTTTNVFEGQTVLTLTVLDPTPDPANDCDLDGSPDGTQDCDGSGTNDVVVKASSENERTPLPAGGGFGEVLFLDNQGGSEYKGLLTISSLADGPGVLFVAQEGLEAPTVTVTYLDNDIDPGPGVEKCPNDVDPTKHGVVQAFTTVDIGTACEVSVVAQIITDNGDHDDFVDTEETVDMQLCVINNCGGDLHNCTGRLFSNSPTVDCILDSVINVGDLANTQDIVCLDEQFRWKMADIQRDTAEQALNAVFGYTMTCDEIDGLSTSQRFTLPLDLDLTDGGQTPTQWLETFESATLGKFSAENLDAGIPGNNNTEGLLNGDGWRCQYSDPDWPNSNSYGNDIALDCYPAPSLASSNAIFWGVDGSTVGSPDGGRSKTGNHSMYYGIFLSDPAGQFTTPEAVVESVQSTVINLGINSPELSWWQQISLIDGRAIQMPTLRSSDRGVVMARTFDNAEPPNPTSDWLRLEPFQNTYDTQAYDFFFNCMFDPVDDGTTEDDFFDPTDSERRLGPSSTCHPGFNYSCIGDTDEPFAVGNICNATTEPGAGDAGDLGTGTWVQSRLDLTPLKGRRIKLRYMVTSTKVGAETWEAQFFPYNPDPRDDGWWIDDVSVDETLANPAEILVDFDDVGHCQNDPDQGCLSPADCGGAACLEGAPQCGDTCTSVTAVVETDPNDNGGSTSEVLSAPGQPIELNASASSGTCLNGALQFRFGYQGTCAVGGAPCVVSADCNGNGPCNGGVLLRGYSENAVKLDAPTSSVTYQVDARCSTDTSCLGTATVDVSFDCPSTGNAVSPFPETILASKSGDPNTGDGVWSWTTSQNYDLWQGALANVSTYAGALSSASGTSFSDPLQSGDKYYIVRGASPYCNAIGAWTSGGPNECPPDACTDEGSRDGDLP